MKNSKFFLLQEESHGNLEQIQPKINADENIKKPG
jgi:hypothetical protein